MRINIEDICYRLDRYSLLSKGIKLEMAKYPRIAADYVYNTKKPFPEAEDSIATDDLASYWYAYGLRKRFIKGEKAILQGKTWIVPYAEKVIHGRWPEAEDIIFSRDTLEDDMRKYVYIITSDPNKKYEDHLFKSGQYSALIRYSIHFTTKLQPKVNEAVRKYISSNEGMLSIPQTHMYNKINGVNN